MQVLESKVCLIELGFLFFVGFMFFDSALELVVLHFSGQGLIEGRGCSRIMLMFVAIYMNFLNICRETA